VAKEALSSQSGLHDAHALDGYLERCRVCCTSGPYIPLFPKQRESVRGREDILIPALRRDRQEKEEMSDLPCTVVDNDRGKTRHDGGCEVGMR